MTRERPPSAVERRLVARCLLSSGILVGSESEIWSHPTARRALRTLRTCVEAAVGLAWARRSVTKTHVVLGAMEAAGSAELFGLDEFVDFVVEDGECRQHWQARAPDDRHPHRCPHCGSAAFVGYLQVDCKARCQSGL